MDGASASGEVRDPLHIISLLLVELDQHKGIHHYRGLAVRKTIENPRQGHQRVAGNHLKIHFAQPRKRLPEPAAPLLMLRPDEGVQPQTFVI